MSTFKIDPTVSSPFTWYAAYEIAELGNHLHLYAKKGDAELLHRIRISLKKIKAVKKALRHSRIKGIKQRRFEVLQTLFDTAGKLREVQIERKLLADWSLHEVKTTIGLDKKEVKWKRKLDKLISGEAKPIADSLMAIQKGTYRVRKKTIRRHLKTTAGAISKALEAIPEEKDWHDIRKQIKVLQYGVKWLQEDDTALPDAAFLVYIKELEIQIGYWNDCLLLIHRIDRCSKKKFKDAAEKESVLAVCREQLNISGKRVRMLIPSN